MSIPVLSKVDIDRRAEKFLKLFDMSLVVEPQVTPLLDVCDWLRNDFDIPISWDANLGRAGSGKRINGAFDFETRSIRIDRSLEPDSPRFRFTLAHEIGHLVLHRKIPAGVRTAVIGDQHVDVDEDMSSDLPSAERSDLEWLEWQANYFAGALLMPEQSVRTAVVMKQQERHVTRNLGRIYVDWRGKAVGELNAALAYLTALYSVTRGVAEVRLSQLEIIQQEAPPRMRHISEW